MSKQFLITLPDDVADLVRSKVSSGRYSSESDVFEESILLANSSPDVEDADLSHWINTEGVRRLAAYDADRSQGMSWQELRATIGDDAEELREAS